MATWTRALVTGGTSGIGAAIAGRLASLGTSSDDVLRSVVSEWQSTVVREPVEPSVGHAMPFPVGTTA